MFYSSKVYFTFALILLYSKVLFGFQRICYFTNWSQYRQINNFKPEDIDPLLCTHIIYAFGLIENGTITNYEEDDILMDGRQELGLYARVMNLKQMNSNLKIMLAVGGWNAGTYPFDQVIANQSTINSFVNDAIMFLRKWKFDGLDIDWEFPTLKKQEFTKLLETLRLKFEIEAVTAASEKLILSAALSSGQAIIDTSYDLKRISQLVDFVNLMTYDLHGNWENTTGFHTALYSGLEDKGEDWRTTLNVNWTVQYLIKNGMSREKIMLGLGFYGHGWILSKIQQNIPGSRTSGPSLPGKIVIESGILSYVEICMAIDNGAIKKWNHEKLSASIQINDNWIGYDDELALLMKVKYAFKNCLGGIMIWSLDLDDFNGKYCKKGPYPLLNSLVDAINNVTEEEECSFGIETPATSITINNINDNEIICNNETELISDVDDCTLFYLCLSGIEYPISKLKCPENMWFDLVSNTCIFTIPHRCKSLPNPLIAEVVAEEKTFNIPIINNIYSSTKSTLTSTTITTTTTTTTPIITTTTKIQTSSTSKTTTTPILISKIQTSLTSTTTKTTTTTVYTESVFTNFIDSTTDLIYEDNLMSYTEDFKCPQPFGLYSSSIDCNAFIMCSHSQPNYRNCPTGLVFNPDIQTCDYTSPRCSEYNFYKTKKFLSRFKSFGKTEFYCPTANGLFENTDNCSTFWNCANEIQILMECPQSLVFNSRLGVCDYTSDCKMKKKGKKSIIYK